MRFFKAPGKKKIPTNSAPITGTGLDKFFDKIVKGVAGPLDWMKVFKPTAVTKNGKTYKISNSGKSIGGRRRKKGGHKKRRSKKTSGG